MIYLTAKDSLIRELEKHFDSKLNIRKRIRVISDLQMFKPKEDLFVWGQKKGKIPEHLMVYFDDIHILTFDETEPLKNVMFRFWVGFREAYSKNSIRLTPPWMIEVEKKETPKEKQLNNLKKIKVLTKEQKIAKEIVKKIIRDQKGK